MGIAIRSVNIVLRFLVRSNFGMVPIATPEGKSGLTEARGRYGVSLFFSKRKLLLDCLVT